MLMLDPILFFLLLLDKVCEVNFVVDELGVVAVFEPEDQRVCFINFLSEFIHKELVLYVFNFFILEFVESVL